MNIRPKNIIVVGGATGIGYATAQLLMENGAESVVLAGRSEKKLQKAAESLKKEKNATNVFTHKLDISKVAYHEIFFKEVENMLGKVPDGLVISSGINYGASNWHGFNITEDDYDNVMNINLKGPFFMIRNFSNYIYEKKLRANICVVSSISAHRDLLGVYQVTKNALSGIVHAYGKHLVQRGIVLNCVEPGSTDTDMMPHLRKYSDGIRAGEEWKDNALKRVLRPREIADAICYLMSENCEILSGTCMLAGGGCRGLSR
jgi:NAD(P)-dependent dehydrogenase (short-subunit alcohol dehydrogenase family)